jgi:hypothetical protein
VQKHIVSHNAESVRHHYDSSAEKQFKPGGAMSDSYDAGQPEQDFCQNAPPFWRAKVTSTQSIQAACCW